MAETDNKPPESKTPDNKQKLLDLFASIVEVPKPDPEKALSTPTAQLDAAYDQANTLFDGTVRPEMDDVDPNAVGRRRFPELQGVAGRFAEGLAKNQDIVDEVLATPDDFAGWISLDQAIGRYVFAGQLLARGGETGEVLAGAAAQKLCLDTLDQARARIQDTSTPADPRSDISTAFAEPFRLEDDEKQRQLQAKATSSQSAQPYRDQTNQATNDVDLTSALDKYIGTAPPPKGNLP